MKKLKVEIITLKFNWLALNIVLTSLLFCYFGYGSDQLLFIRSVFLILPIIFLLIRNSSDKFQDKLTIHVSDILVVISLFSTFVFLGKEYIFRFPGGDEGAYTLIAFQTPISFLERIKIFGPNFQVVNGLRIISLLVALAVFLIAFYCRSIKTLVLFLFASIIMSGVLFHALGGFPAGYSKLSTLPLVLSTSVFGLSGASLHLTMVFMFTIFLWAFWRHLIKVAPQRSGLILLAIFSFASLSSTIYLSSLIDHSFYFIIFASIPILNILTKDSFNPERWVGLLVIGVYFRITIVFVLVAYILFIYKSNKFARWMFAIPFLTFPYLISFYISGRGGKIPVSLPNGDSGNLLNPYNAFLSSLVINQTWINIITFIILFILALKVNLKSFVFIVIYILLSFIVYFIFLDFTIVGNPKYQLEWLSTLTLCLVGSILTSFKGSFLIGTFSVLTIIIICFNILQSLNPPRQYQVLDSSLNYSYKPGQIYSLSDFALVNPIDKYEDVLARVPSSYRSRCSISGTTYGQILEILAGRNQAEILNLKALHVELFKNRNDSSKMANSSDFDLASESGFRCLITRGDLIRSRDSSFSEWYLFYKGVGDLSHDKLKIYLRLN